MWARSWSGGTVIVYYARWAEFDERRLGHFRGDVPRMAALNRALGLLMDAVERG